MGKLRDNLNLIFSNLLFGANFSIYVSLVRNWFDFRQLFLLQVGAAALFFIPFALLSPRTPRMRWADLKNILIVTVLIIYGWMYTMLWGATYTNPPRTAQAIPHAEQGFVSPIGKKRSCLSY